MSVEREIKLRFASVDSARASLADAGLTPTPLRARRLQRDSLYDTAQNALYERASTLRLRQDGAAHVLTFKGPPQPGPMKLREEHETAVDDGAALAIMLRELGMRVWFRYEKYREEFRAGDLIVAIDETPVGVFVELEGTETAITSAAHALGFVPQDYITASYRTLYLEYCNARQVAPQDMLFS